MNDVKDTRIRGLDLVWLDPDLTVPGRSLLIVVTCRWFGDGQRPRISVRNRFIAHPLCFVFYFS